ncbi:MAG: low specificity L-threonine aldolase [Thermoplasmatales archaeon]|nr:MAG: low specificity L-threonine aldolase [Thermoplasmatales archaeon]
MSNNKGFASDNHSGVHPDILKAIESANIGHATAYGDDEYTERAIKKFKEHFGNNVDAYFVYNGTAANILGLKNITDSFNSIICAETAHLNVHECCGPEKFTGCKLITIPTIDGKLTIDKIRPHIVGLGDPHRAQPKVISITQPTELGTVYTPKEIKELTDFSHKNGMLVHMDGARLCNAVVSLDVGMKDITGDVGVDILSFGGTKNGMMLGESVVFFNKKLSKNFVFIRKQGMQLASKMRFISAQFEAFLSNDLWLKNARHANRMARLLYKEVKDIPQIKIKQKVETNAVFATIPKKYIVPLQREYFFHVFNEQTSEVRWMCSFDTNKEDIMKFSEIISRTIV